jgi:gluconokinase
MLQRVKRWLSLGEFIFDRLFDHTVVSTSIASWGGLLNRRTPQWDDDWFKQLPVSSDQFSSLVDASKSLRGLKSEWASRWPMLKAVPWFPAVGDGAAANLGSGCSSADRLALTIGTSGALRLALPGTPESIPFGLWCYRIDHDTSLLGGATNEGGNVYAWLRQTLQLTPDDQFGQAIAAIAPDSHGLTALPFLAGERSPGYVGGARAAIDGLSISTRPIEIARALLEAIAYRFAIIQRRIAAAYPSSASGKIIASGGGLLSQPAWLQIFADVLNQPVIASAEKEATSRGAALLALRSIGAIQSFDEAPADLGPMFAPDPDRHTIYLKAIERQQQLYDVLVKSEA